MQGRRRVWDNSGPRDQASSHCPPDRTVLKQELQLTEQKEAVTCLIYQQHNISLLLAARIRAFIWVSRIYRHIVHFHQGTPSSCPPRPGNRQDFNCCDRHWEQTKFFKQIYRYQVIGTKLKCVELIMNHFNKIS